MTRYFVSIKLYFFLILCLCLLQVKYSNGQCPTGNFTFTDNFCIDENFNIENNSTNASSYVWDFCEGDLGQIPTADLLFRISETSAPRAIEIIHDGNNWYGFITSRANNSLLRLDFGTSLDNTAPSVTNLGNVGNLLSSPEPIQLLQENGNWYALIHNGGNSTLTRIDFGINVDNNSPTAELILTSIGNLNSGMDLAIDNGNVVAVIAMSSRKVLIVNFGNSITNSIDMSNVLDTGNPPGISGAIIDFQLVKQCDTWYGLGISFGSNHFYRLDFGTSLNAAPTLSIIGTNSIFGSDRPYRIESGYDNGDFFVFVSTVSGNIHTLNLGSDLSNINTMLTGTNLGNLGLLGVGFSLELVKENSQWYAFSLNNTTRDLFRITFNNDCPASISNSTSENISALSYAQSGTYNIGLTSSDNNGNIDRLTKSVTVSVDIAPDIAFSSQNICLSNPINFLSSNASADITAYSWNFGDTNTSTGSNPSHSYSTAGEYEVTLDVESMNGCHNFTRQMITIYDDPVPDFTLPSGTICTNEEYTFVNNTIDNFNGNLTYEWQVDGSVVSTERDLMELFINEGSKEIKLITSIQGCDVEQVQNITNVNLGAIPSYSYDTNTTCMGDPINFINESTGISITNYMWDFGDTNTSSDVNPTHIYNTPATYMVSLQVTNAAGCITTYQEEVIIRSLPTTDFLTELACTDRSTQFSDLSTVDNANVFTWDWDFGDTSSGSTNVSSEKNPTHTFSETGNFNISLSVTSNYGCEDNVSKVISVLESPIIDFTVDPKCVGDAFLFSDISIPNSGGSIISRAWNINGTAYSSKDPSHTFSDSGTFDATLTIRSDNLCTISTTKSIVVNKLPAVDFSISSNCIGAEVSLEDQTALVNDNIVSWQWTVDGQDAGNTSAIMYVFNEATNYEIKLQVITERGCIVSTTKNDVTFFDLPIAAFNPSPQYSAAPALVDFNNFSKNAVSYEWDFGDTSNNSTDESPSHTYTDLGVYDVALTAKNDEGCIDMIVKQVHVVNPQIDLSIDDIATFNNGESLLFTISNKGSIPVNNVTATISLNNEVFVNENFDLTILPDQVSVPRSLSFTIPDKGNIEFLCISLSTSEGVDINNIDNTECINIDSDFEIITPYPSPVSRQELLTLPLIGEKNDEVTIALVNASGKQFVSENVTLIRTGLNNINLSLFSLKPGIYFIHVQSIKIAKTFRIFVN